MGNNMVPYTFAIGEKYTYFIPTLYKFIENDKIEERTLLNATNDCSDPFDYHLEKCGIESFKVLEHSQYHTFYAHDEEDEEDKDDLVEEDEEKKDLIQTICMNGNYEMVKIFNQKCVFCLERDSVYACRLCRHQCYQNRGDIDILTCVVCKT